MLNYDIVVVGAGPAGSAAALKAASAGKNKRIINRDEIYGRRLC